MTKGETSTPDESAVSQKDTADTPIGLEGKSANNEVTTHRQVTSARRLSRVRRGLIQPRTSGGLSTTNDTLLTGLRPDRIEARGIQSPTACADLHIEITTDGNEATDSGEKVTGVDTQEYKFTTLSQRHPEWPDVIVTFAYAPHGTARDMQFLLTQVKGYHVYFWEGVCSDRQIADDYTHDLQILADVNDQSLKTGETNSIDAIVDHSTVDDNKPVKGRSAESAFRAIYASRMVIGHMDHLPGEDGFQPPDEIVRMYRDRTFIVPGFDDTLENFRQIKISLALYHDRREEAMTTRFEKELGDMIKDHERLRSLSTIHVIVPIGSGHSSKLDRRFEAAGIKSQRVYSRWPYIFDHDAQVDRQMDNGIQPTRDEMAQAYATNLILHRWERSRTEWLTDTNQESLFLRNIISRFTTEEIESLHQMQISHKLTTKRINQILKSKGIPTLPRTNEQLAECVTLLTTKQQKERAIAA